MLRLFCILSLALLAACGQPPSVASKTDPTAEIAALSRAIAALGPNVDPAEAARAARIAYEHTDELAEAYQITDPALIHNMKVNAGLKPRGLCWHWAEDMEARLVAEDFRTLSLHRAIANADNPFLIDHSTAIIAARGADYTDGIVLDPWRYGGVLFWAPLVEDTRYVWEARDAVLARQRARLAAAN